MDAEFKKLNEELRWGRQRLPRYRPRALGSSLERYMKGVVRPKKRKASPIVAAWNEVVPEGLTGCRIAKVERGVLTIELEDASMLYEMEMLKHELLGELRAKSGSIYVKDIRFVI